MVNKNTLITVGVTLAVLAALSNVRAARDVKRFILG
jgi:hypothetical protein